MGFKTYTIFCSDQPGYFGTYPTHDPAKALQVLSLLGLQEYALVNPDASVNDYPDSNDLYIGAYDAGVVIAHETLPALLFDEASRKRNFGRIPNNPLFTKGVHELFPEGEVTALILQSTVNMWGYSVHRKGKLIRSASGAEGEFYGSIGEPLAEELSILAEHPIETIDKGDVAYSEELVFEVAERVLGKRYDEADLGQILKCSHFRKTPKLQTIWSKLWKLFATIADFPGLIFDKIFGK